MNRAISTILLIYLTMASISFADDTIILKNGNQIQGKIIQRDDRSIVMDTGVGTNITYYSDEIASVNQQPLASSADKNPSQNSVEQTTSTSNGGVPLTEDEKKQLVQNILYLKNQSFKSITCRLSYGSFEKYDQRMQQIMKMMGDIYTVKINWQEYKIIFDSSGNTSFIHPSIAVDINPQLKDKMEQTQPNWHSQMAQLSESFKEKMNGNLKEIDDGTIKIMETIAGVKNSNKLTSPQRLPNGQITDSGSVNVGQAMAAITGASSGESAQAGMAISMRYLYEPRREKFIIREIDMNIKMPQVMDMKTHYKIDYQHLDTILFPGKIFLAIETASQNNNAVPTQKQQEELTFDRCVVQ